MTEFNPSGLLFGFGEALWLGLWEWLDPPRPLPKPDPAADKKFERLLAQDPRFSDPVYRANVQKLIERSRRFEDSKE